MCALVGTQGFVAGGHQAVAVYARTDEQDVYVPVKKAKLPREWGRVTSVSVSENEESAVLCVDTKQVVHMHLSRTRSCRVRARARGVAGHGSSDCLTDCGRRER